MIENPEFSALLDKHHINHGISPQSRIQVAVRMLTLCPTNFDAYSLAFGDVPKTYKQFIAIIDFVKNEQNKDERMGLREAFEKLIEEGEKIYPKEE